MNTTEELLKAILSIVARKTFPPDVLAKIVMPTVGSDKQLLAYNLCDGETPQADICKKVKLDRGNFSRAVARWIEAGVVVRVGSDRLPLHVYPLNKGTLKAEGGKS
ncbi:MAG TPA: helix-turn-helix domain-containing protein [Xanthobacteraceae bacterium]|nr:helix-turn-helix domain-containing protein [Xanthobacteraceae bacterium]